jgi:choline dehydrogenase-like flavoprotein
VIILAFGLVLALAWIFAQSSPLDSWNPGSTWARYFPFCGASDPAWGVADLEPGAVVAKELAEAGYAVVMLEEGEYRTRREFTGRPSDSLSALYRRPGESYCIGNAIIPIPLGRSVGGTTTINSGTCLRAPDAVLERWREELGLDEFTPEQMRPYFERVERELQVAEAKAEYLGGVARVVARGCEALGWSHHALRRNAPDCDGQGVCCFGSPTDAKRSTNLSHGQPAADDHGHGHASRRANRQPFELSPHRGSGARPGGRSCRSSTEDGEIRPGSKGNSAESNLC